MENKNQSPENSQEHVESEDFPEDPKTAEDLKEEGEGTSVKKPRSNVPIANVRNVFKSIDEKRQRPVTHHALEYSWKIIEKLVSALTTQSVVFAQRETKNATLLIDHLRKGGLVEALYGDLIKHAREEIDKAINAFENSDKGGRLRQEMRAGLTLPVSKISSIITDNKVNFKVSNHFQIAMTAVAEYILAEMITEASKKADSDKRDTIYDRDLYEGIKEDHELNRALGDFIEGIELKNVKKPKVSTTKKEEVVDGEDEANEVPVSRKAPSTKKVEKASLKTSEKKGPVKKMEEKENPKQEKEKPKPKATFSVKKTDSSTSSTTTPVAAPANAIKKVVLTKKKEEPKSTIVEPKLTVVNSKSSDPPVVPHPIKEKNKLAFVNGKIANASASSQPKKEESQVSSVPPKVVTLIKSKSSNPPVIPPPKKAIPGMKPPPALSEQKEEQQEEEEEEEEEGEEEEEQEE